MEHGFQQNNLSLVHLLLRFVAAINEAESYCIVCLVAVTGVDEILEHQLLSLGNNPDMKKGNINMCFVFEAASLNVFRAR